MMMFLVLLLQGNYEEWGIKSILIGAILGISGVVVYLYKSKETAIKDKDAKIMEVIKEHQNDLKENATDMKKLAENYYKFTQTIKDLVNGNNKGL